MTAPDLRTAVRAAIRDVERRVDTCPGCDTSKAHGVHGKDCSWKALRSALTAEATEPPRDSHGFTDAEHDTLVTLIDRNPQRVRQMLTLSGRGAGLATPLSEVPMDGTHEVLHEGQLDGEAVWLRFTPKHHLASVASNSPVYVIARTIWPESEEVDDAE
jgi:anti-sigma factor RsiW